MKKISSTSFHYVLLIHLNLTSDGGGGLDMSTLFFFMKSIERNKEYVHCFDLFSNSFKDMGVWKIQGGKKITPPWTFFYHPKLLLTNVLYPDNIFYLSKFSIAMPLLEFDR